MQIFFFFFFSLLCLPPPCSQSWLYGILLKKILEQPSLPALTGCERFSPNFCSDHIMSCQFSPGARGHRPSKTDASIFRIVVTSHDCHFAELWLSNIANPVGRGQNNSLVSFLATLWFFNSLPMNEPIKQTIIEWGALIVLPQDGEHKRFKVLTQLMRDPDTVPFLRARSTVSPKHLQESGVSLDRQSQARCYKQFLPLYLPIYVEGYFCCVFALFSTTRFSTSASGDRGCAGFWYTRAHTRRGVSLATEMP